MKSKLKKKLQLAAAASAFVFACTLQLLQNAPRKSERDGQSPAERDGYSLGSRVNEAIWSKAMTAPLH